MKGTGSDIAVLKSWDFGAWNADLPGQLPYRMDRLERLGYRLHWSDRMFQDAWRHSVRVAILKRAESTTVPFVQVAMMTPAIRRCAATLAMFESEANFLALVRSLSPLPKRRPLLVISCWLAHILSTAADPRKLLYRQAYRGVDRLYYLSRNQGPVLEEALRLSPQRLRYLPFGVDTETFVPTTEPEGDYVLAVGRDRGRDWPVFFEAVRGLELPVKVCCRQSDIAGLEIPPNVEVLGYVDRETYRTLLGRACVVAVVTRAVTYPTGQSVLLEALAMARAVVITATESIEEYVRNGVDCLAVPPADPSAVREMIINAASDPGLRHRLGCAGRAIVEERYSSDTMWEVVGSDLANLGVLPRRDRETCDQETNPYSAFTDGSE